MEEPINCKLGGLRVSIAMLEKPLPKQPESDSEATPVGRPWKGNGYGYWDGEREEDEARRTSGEYRSSLFSSVAGEGERGNGRRRWPGNRLFWAGLLNYGTGCGSARALFASFFLFHLLLTSHLPRRRPRRLRCCHLDCCGRLPMLSFALLIVLVVL